MYVSYLQLHFIIDLILIIFNRCKKFEHMVSKIKLSDNAASQNNVYLFIYQG